jgi:TRAP-type mannitol/chloroaromatic compound transport system substrate-binding protein
MQGFIVAALAGAALVAAAGEAAAQQKISLRLTSFAAEASSVYQTQAKPFIEAVRTLTDGRVEIQGFGVGAIAGMFDQFKAVESGLADFAYSGSTLLFNRHVANAVTAGPPGGMGLEAYMHWLYEGGGAKLLNEFRRETMGLHTVPLGGLPTEVFAHSHKPIRNVEDLKGIRFRTAGPWADVIQVFGGTPTTVAAAEIFTMLERRAIDATEFLSPVDNLALGFHRAARYVILPGVHGPGTVLEVAMKKEKWDALPADIRRKIELAAEAITLSSTLKLGIADLDAMAKLRAGGNEIVMLSPEFIKAVKAEGRKWTLAKAEEMAAKGDPWMKRLAESYYAFQDRWDANAVYRVSN